jgi:flagellin-specific chaperone FliS
MKALTSVLILGALVTGPVYAACSYPRAPANLPDGSTATKEEMKAAQQEFQAYNNAIKAYTDCLNLEHDERIAKDPAALTEDQKKELDRMRTQKNNAAIDEAEAVTARFNEQVRAFNARPKKEKG